MRSRRFEIAAAVVGIAYLLGLGMLLAWQARAPMAPRTLDARVDQLRSAAVEGGAVAG